MPVLPIGVRLESMGVSLREAIPMAARIGARAVQFDALGPLSPGELSQTGRRELRYMITSHGMSIAAIGFPTRHGYDSLERLDARVLQTKKTLAFAREMGAPIVVNRLGTIPEERTPATVHFFESVEQIGREADRVGSRFAIETGENPPQRLAEFLDEMNLYGLAVNFDPGNLVARGYEVYENVVRLRQWIAGVHVKDVVASGASLAGATETAMGTGDIDWELLLGRLHEIEYAGALIVERETGDDRIAQIRAAIEYVARLQGIGT